MTDKKCLICDSKISKRNSKFCSKSCYTKHQLSKNNKQNKEVRKKCKQCDKLFWVKNYMKHKTKFCSKECSILGQERPTIGNDSRVFKICEHCGEEYKVHKYRSSNSKYCSKKCKHSVGRIRKKCKYCKNDFETVLHKEKTFCSLKCSQKYYGPSKLENDIYDVLFKNFGIKNIKTQETIYGDTFYYCVDFLIYDKIIIEVFGDYWHCNPRLFSDDFFHKQCNKTASEIRTNDKIKIENLKNTDYIVFTIWEDHDIYETFNNNLNNIINEIHRYKKNKKIKDTKLYYMNVRNNHNFLANDFCLHNCGYRGEIQATFNKVNPNLPSYEVGDRICQLMILPYPKVRFTEVEELSQTERGDGGFGSTGK